MDDLTSGSGVDDGRLTNMPSRDDRHVITSAPASQLHGEYVGLDVPWLSRQSHPAFADEPAGRAKIKSWPT